MIKREVVVISSRLCYKRCVKVHKYEYGDIGFNFF